MNGEVRTIKAFIVREKYPGKYDFEGAKFDFTGTFMLTISANDLTAAEIEDVKNGPIEFYLTEKMKYYM